MNYRSLLSKCDSPPSWGRVQWLQPTLFGVNSPLVAFLLRERKKQSVIKRQLEINDDSLQLCGGKPKEG